MTEQPDEESQGRGTPLRHEPPTSSPVSQDRAFHAANALRLANGIAAACLCVIFIAHAILGSIKFGNPFFTGQMEWLIWVGVGIIAVHIGLSIATTVSMMTDTARPPSQKKKRHQLLKWLSGAAVLVLAGAHVLLTSGVFPGAAPILTNATFVLMAALIAALGWHMFTASKSLLKDLRVPDHKRFRPALRAVLLTGCIAAGIILITAL